jgi:uncharacterized membrane protein YidH (DUF202 family)
MDFLSTKIAYADLNTFLTHVNVFIVNPLIGFMIALGLAYFLYGVFEFLANQENEEKKTSGKSHMLWGLIGIAIMLGVWGILNLVVNTFSINGVHPETGEVQLPN